MLVELSIANYALIDQLRLSLSRGFTVLTGETGAGKTIILDALGFLLGDRADASMVRAEAERAVVEGIFELPPALAGALGEMLDVDVATDGLILARELSANGRSVCRINGRAVPQRRLAEVGSRIVDIHGQGEHLSLLRPAEHLQLLDRFGGLGVARARFASVVAEIGSVRRRLKALRKAEEELATRADLLRFQAEEIAAARLKPGEEEALVIERNLMLNAEKAVQLAEEAVRALEPDHPGPPGALELLGAAVRALSALERFEPRFSRQRGTAESAVLDLQELVSELRGFAEGLEYDQRRLDDIQGRLDRIASLKRKYGPSVEAVLAFGETAGSQLDERGLTDRRIAELEVQESQLLDQAAVLAGELFRARLEAAHALTSAVEQQLRELGMEGARLAVTLGHQPGPNGLVTEGVVDVVVESQRSLAELPAPVDSPLRFDSTGVDSIEFLIAANPGEPLKPLASTASGGETSRLMLAIKGALAEADPVPVLIFDEIDAGIGGRVGEVVGRRLWALGRSHQVLAVTHLPQIASSADSHFAVRKVVEGGRTYTSGRLVSGDERLREIGSMLGTETSVTLAKAAELLERRPG